LTYHGIGRTKEDPFWVTPEEFEEEVEYLVRTQKVATVDRVVDVARRRTTDSVTAITFDDGLVGVFQYAFPILRNANISGTIFVNAETLEARRKTRDGYLTSWQIERLMDYGFKVGSHGYRHANLARCDERALWLEIVRSKAILERAFSCTIRYYSYAYGTRASIPRRAVRLVEESGYLGAFTAINGSNRPGDNPYWLYRTKVEGHDGPIFDRIVRGNLDLWALVDNYGGMVQRTTGAPAGG
jgi:peptidoglycan/xylan/chitin deacetylase (PgdA/CDA1 family)